jgi:hypothetical protein
VKSAIADGQFRIVDPEFVRLLVSSTIIGVMWTRGPDPTRGSSTRSHELPDFVLRALLERPDDLEVIKKESETLQHSVRERLQTE